jgi:hypothetical protein
METGTGRSFGLLQRSVARASARAERETKSLYNFIPVYRHKTECLLPAFKSPFPVT